MLSLVVLTELEKFFDGEESLMDVVKKEASIEKDVPEDPESKLLVRKDKLLNLQCDYCVYKNCIHNNTKKEDLPSSEDWKVFQKFKGCFSCQRREGEELSPCIEEGKARRAP